MRMKPEKKFFPGCIAALLLLAAAGCLLIYSSGGGLMMRQKDTVPPGTLAGISYHFSSGMVRGQDFSITLSTQAIVETTYWPSPDAEPVTKKDVPITEAQWSDVEQIILELYPEMKPVPEKRFGDKILSLVARSLNVRDGGDSASLTLTWNTESGTRNIRYYKPNDYRFHTLIELLKELVDSIGENSQL